MRTGYIISGIGHGLLLLWLLVGGLIAWQREEPSLRVAEVSLVSGAEFAALMEGAETPAAVRPAPRPEPEPEPEPEPDPAPPPPRPEPPAPEPEPEPEPEPAPPEPEPETPPETPPEAPRVADEVIAPPEEPAPPGPELIEDTAPDEAVEPEPDPVTELPTQAPEATTTEIVTEADTPSETAAPTASPRPRARPTPPPVEVAEPAPDPAPDPEPEPDTVLGDAIEGALAEATAPQVAQVPSGPPLTRGEQDGLRIAVQECWNVGSLSTDALATTVVVLVRMARDGKPESVEMLSSDGATPTATRGAYEAARRAVIRCGARGFPLPAEKYDQWREIEMTFDPSGMRLR